MKYNFDEKVRRWGTNCVKWDVNAEENVIPLWVADMDFKTAPAIIEALRRRVDHGVFGYTLVPEEYYKAVMDWFGRCHGWKIERDWIMYTSGVVPALSAIIKGLTKPGDGVIVQTPVYNCFFSSIRNNGCTVVENPLIYHDDTYTMDFDNLEKLASKPEVTMMLLCNPHNPAGRVWRKWELEKVADICSRNNVIIVSDEIHCELVFKPYQYIPFGVVAAEKGIDYIECTSASKAFNTAGLQIANIISNKEEYRTAVDRAININEVCDVNPFGVVGTIAAYNEGEGWLDALINYLHGNYECLCCYFRERMPELKVTRLEGTYLVWVDCRETGFNTAEINDILVNKAKVRINPGTMYGLAGEGFIRINIACPRAQLEEGLHRILYGFDLLRAKK